MIEPTNWPIGISVLGSTGSIGTQTLDVARSHPDRFRVVSLAAGSNLDLLQKQIHEFHPAIASHESQQAIEPPSSTRVIASPAGLVECATHPEVDVVVVATSGIASLHAVMEAAKLGKVLALANKEVLVCAADILMPIIARSGGELRPVDSEHSAIWQCLGSQHRTDIRKLTLTASGGPFRTVPADQLEVMRASDALCHPTWVMGSKITIDSATLVNKGLEVIEAHHLFDVPYDQIDVVVHPESIVHSLVEFLDGSTLAQLSNPDMRLPIQFALSTPQHLPREVPSLNLANLGSLSFEEPDRVRFPALDLCMEAGKRGSSTSIALCAADEIAVDAYLVGSIRFTDIPHILSGVIDQTADGAVGSIAEIEDRLAEATARARLHLTQRQAKT